MTADVLLKDIYLRLGQLHRANKKNNMARQAVSRAVELFKSCNAKAWLEQANTAIEHLQ